MNPADAADTAGLPGLAAALLAIDPAGLGGAALAVADRVHRHAAADIGVKPGIGSPEPRLEAARQYRLAQFGPGAAHA